MQQVRRNNTKVGDRLLHICMTQPVSTLNLFAGTTNYIPSSGGCWSLTTDAGITKSGLIQSNLYRVDERTMQEFTEKCDASVQAARKMEQTRKRTEDTLRSKAVLSACREKTKAMLKQALDSVDDEGDDALKAAIQEAGASFAQACDEAHKHYKRAAESELLEASEASQRADDALVALAAEVSCKRSKCA